MVFKNNWSEFDYDKDEDVQEYLKLLDKIQNEPDKFGLVYDEKITYPETAFGKIVFIRHVVWWEVTGNGKEKQFA
jgi:hypothetical protein